MKLPRASGILLHPASLPGTPGIGTIGKNAFSFVDFLTSSSCSLWQMLPLGPTGYGDSPYQSFSTFAGNPLLIDLDDIVTRGWAQKKDIVPPDYIKSEGKIDYGAVVSWKIPVLKKCVVYFAGAGAKSKDAKAYALFCRENKFWLDDFASFMSIKDFYDAKAKIENEAASANKKNAHVSGMWNSYWPRDLASHNKKAVGMWIKNHCSEVESYKIIQFFFYTQWTALKSYANKKGVSLIGDIPIFVAPDSADVWAHQNLFQVNARGVPKKVAGVPPDYFSATGQLWGNPLYDWSEMKRINYAWWIARIKQACKLTDYVRIDHFRGFEAYWAIPYGDRTAVGGKWMSGPGRALFDAIKKSLGDVPVIAEDLGVITDKVRALRDGCGFPGMKVLQFAFDVNEKKNGNLINVFLPHEYERECVVYTGTHDNDTVQGWVSSLDTHTRSLASSYFAGHECSEKEIDKSIKNGTFCFNMIRAAFASTASFAIVPLQDVYAVGSEGRMNTPSTSGANWSWRMSAEQINGASAKRAEAGLAELNMLYGRKSSYSL
jgi:4-alpha-glucanotransferase